MNRKERFKLFLEYFQANNPEPKTELLYTTPYSLLVAVVLSAQCTDKRVNMTMPAFLDRFPDAAHLSVATAEEILPVIKSISFPNNKAKALSKLGRILYDKFGGIVPGDVDELQELPGVGRKTANVIASVIFNKPALAVDTHVFRVSRRMGLANISSKTPLDVERQLMKYLPTELVNKSHHWLILHGRYICLARKPKCRVCPVSHLCRYYEKLLAAAFHTAKTQDPQ